MFLHWQSPDTGGVLNWTFLRCKTRTVLGIRLEGAFLHASRLMRIVTLRCIKPRNSILRFFSQHAGVSARHYDLW
jgi:hypothetical protein